MTEWTDTAVDAATRIICRGLPLDAPGQPQIPDEARDLCFGPACACWNEGRKVTRAALDAARKAQETKHD